MATRLICEIEGCDSDVKYPSMKLCAACYQGIRFWRDRSATDVKKRQKQIARLGNRMATMQPWVTIMKDNQKKRAAKIRAKIRRVNRATRKQAA